MPTQIYLLKVGLGYLADQNKPLDELFAEADKYKTFIKNQFINNTAEVVIIALPDLVSSQSNLILLKETF